MKLSEQLEVISPSARIRIIRGQMVGADPAIDRNTEILFCNYKGMLQHTDSSTEWLTSDPLVVQFRAGMEIRHKEYKSRGLLPPYEPELTRQYEFKDLTVFLYYDIYI